MANNMTEPELQNMCEQARFLGFIPERLLRLDNMLESWVGERRITQALAVRVNRHGQLAFEGAYGQRGCAEEEGSMTMDTIFPLCSHTKTITAALMCILQEQGLLEFSQRARLFLPELNPGYEDVRLWQLLSHSAGLHNGDVHNWVDSHIKDTLKLVKPERGAPDEEWDALCLQIREKMYYPDMAPGENMRDDTFRRLAFAAPPSFPPGTQMVYAGVGYEVAGAIIEKMTGKTLEEAARELLLEPLDMADTYWEIPAEKMPRFYRRGPRCESWKWLSEGILKNKAPDNGIKSTARDMCRLVDMILGDGELEGARVLSPASVEMMLKNYNERLPVAFYNGEWLSPAWGLGWNVRCGKIDDAGMLRSDRSFEHGGYGGSKILGDPHFDVSIAFFGSHPAENPDWNWSGAHVNNMVFAAIGDMKA